MGVSGLFPGTHKPTATVCTAGVFIVLVTTPAGAGAGASSREKRPVRAWYVARALGRVLRAPLKASRPRGVVFFWPRRPLRVEASKDARKSPPCAVR